MEYVNDQWERVWVREIYLYSCCIPTFDQIPLRLSTYKNVIPETKFLLVRKKHHMRNNPSQIYGVREPNTQGFIYVVIKLFCEESSGLQTTAKLHYSVQEREVGKIAKGFPLLPKTT